ncbi:hypothetical protein [Anaerovorax sp. IOR16]|uniref:hypothetical protein n=1 Tax=Anaerovorax sp. IOR16 TaxID=2773458 RepID=UPI0019CFE560|nr:hypothetical protein [Anaerovorax sp. IOR16]
MNINWFKNQDNIVYAELDKVVPLLSKETGIFDLEKKIKSFQDNPTTEDTTLRGTKRVSLKLFIPNLIFDEKLEMGDNVWVFMGETRECYCLYTPWETV